MFLVTPFVLSQVPLQLPQVGETLLFVSKQYDFF